MTNIAKITISKFIVNRFAKIACGLSILLISHACASTPPSKTLPQAKVAVESIDHKNYHQYVLADVEAVKAKLKQAQELEAAKKQTSSEKFAQQIVVDVEYIQIKTQRIIIEKEVKEIETNIKNLNDELKWREPIQVSPLN